MQERGEEVMKRAMVMPIQLVLAVLANECEKKSEGSVKEALSY